MRTARGEKEKLRTVILGKAIAYLKKHGRGESGTDQIMKHMGLTRGALYSHFKSKDDLFAHAVCFDLKNLEENLTSRFETEGKMALKNMIEDHLSEKSLTNVGNSCVFTSLSTDMQRCEADHRAMFEKYMIRIYALFAQAMKEQFPEDTTEENLAKAINLYSALVGTLTMARTIKDPKLARQTLKVGRTYLIRSFSPQTPF